MSNVELGIAGRMRESSWFTQNRLAVMVAILPVALFFGLVWFLPIGYTFWMSFFEQPTGAHRFVALGNYIEVLTGGSFWEYLWNSVVFAVSTTLGSLVVGLLLALVINQNIRGRNSLRTLMILPYLLPTVLVVFFWTFMLDQNLGLVNIVLQRLGLISSPIAFFSNPTFALPSIVVTSIWKWASFAFFIILANLQAIPDEYYERAQVQGATLWQQFRDITLPQLRGAILLILIVRGIWMFNKFDVIWLTTHGGPLDLTTTLPINVFTLAVRLGKLGQAAALAMLMFLVLAVFGVLYFTVLDPVSEGDDE